MPKSPKPKPTKEVAPKRPRISRAQKSREVQGAITAAALELLASSGVDGLALTKIAAQAELSNGPLYGRYDSAEDVALELWDSQLRQQFLQLLSEFDAFLSSDDDTVSDWLLQELTAPSELTAGAVEIIAVARRFPLLVDTVRADVERVFDHSRSALNDEPDAFAALRLTLPVGCVLTSRSVPSSRPPWAPMLLRLREALRSQKVVPAAGDSPEPRKLSIPTPNTGDAGLDEFVLAVMEVVARVGFEKTTAHRVARTAGHSFSSAYSHVGTKDELMHMAIGHMMDQIWETGTASFISLSEDDYKTAIVSLQLGLLDEANRAIRQLRTETTIAMRHHTDLADAGRKRTEASLSRITDALGVENPSTEAAASFWYLTNANGIGTVALSLLTSAFRTIDWSPMAAIAYDLALETTIEPLRKLKKLPLD